MADFGFLNLTLLSWYSGAIGFAIVAALLVSLTIVYMQVRSIGGYPGSHAASIAESLDAVAVQTDPVPTVLTAINTDLGELARTLDQVEGHLRAARTLFETLSEGA